MVDKKTKKQHDNIVNLPVSSDVDGMLSLLLRKIIIENNLSSQIERRIDIYSVSPNRGGGKKKSKSAMRELISKDRMTIKSFYEVLDEIIRPKRARLSVEIEFENGSKGVHTITIIGDEDDNGTQ